VQEAQVRVVHRRQVVGALLLLRLDRRLLALLTLLAARRGARRSNRRSSSSSRGRWRGRGRGGLCRARLDPQGIDTRRGFRHSVLGLLSPVGKRAGETAARRRPARTQTAGLGLRLGDRIGKCGIAEGFRPLPCPLLLFRKEQHRAKRRPSLLRFQRETGTYRYISVEHWVSMLMRRSKKTGRYRIPVSQDRSKGMQPTFQTKKNYARLFDRSCRPWTFWRWTDIRTKEQPSEKEVKESEEMCKFQNPKLASMKIALKCTAEHLALCQQSMQDNLLELRRQCCTKHPRASLRQAVGLERIPAFAR